MSIGRKWESQVRWSGQSKPMDALRALVLSTLIGEARITVFTPCERDGGIVPTTGKEIAFDLGYISHVCTTVLIACVGISELL